MNTVSPGYAPTDRVRRQRDIGGRDPSHPRRKGVLDRMVEPSGVADAVAVLMSARAPAITGVNLPVDCGWLLAPSWNTYGGPVPKR